MALSNVFELEGAVDQGAPLCRAAADEFEEVVICGGAGIGDRAEIGDVFPDKTAP